MTDPNLRRDFDGADHLVGTRCRSCDTSFFPASAHCRRCGGTEVEDVGLARGGAVVSYTRMGPDGDPAVGEVRLDDDMLVFGRIVPPAAAAVGRRVHLVPDEIVSFEIADGDR